MLTAYKTNAFTWRLSKHDKQRIVETLQDVYDTGLPIGFFHSRSSQAVTIFEHDEPTQILFDIDFVLMCLSDVTGGYLTLLEVYRHEIAHFIAGTLNEPYMDNDDMSEKLLIETNTKASRASRTSVNKLPFYVMEDVLLDGQHAVHKRYHKVRAFKFYKFQ
jgi:hypothetical protein